MRSFSKINFSLFLLLIITINLTVSVSHSKSTELSGVGVVIDADTIKVEEKRVRLHGIDAPEAKQSCKNRNGLIWSCGKRATQALQKKINGKTIKCIGNKTDRYKRVIAICYLNKINLNRWLVSNGWAVAYRKYSKDYVSAEAIAQSNLAGVWSGEFVMPWRWRRGSRLKD